MRPPPLLRQQDLRVDGGKGHGQFLADGVLALDGKGIGNARDGGGHVGRVQRGEDEVAGLCGGDGDAHGFGVAHFADDDDVGRLAECGAQGGGKIGRVGADLDLLDDAAQVWCSYSMGSSMMTMWRASRRLMSSIRCGQRGGFAASPAGRR